MKASKSVRKLSTKLFVDVLGAYGVHRLGYLLTWPKYAISSVPDRLTLSSLCFPMTSYGLLGSAMEFLGPLGTIGVQDHGTKELWEYGTMGLWNQETMRLWDHGALGH